MSNFQYQTMTTIESFTPPPSLSLGIVRTERQLRNATTPTQTAPKNSPTTPTTASAIPASVATPLKIGFLRMLSKPPPVVTKPSTPNNGRTRPPTPGGRYDKLAEGNNLLKTLLKEDKLFHDLLLKFSEIEFSSETVLFFDALMDYRSALHDKPILFRKLYETYVQTGSLREVNLASSVKEQVELFVATGDWAMADRVEDLLEHAAVISLMDVFYRFENSDMYQLLKSTR
jgi:hypothetical protein